MELTCRNAEFDDAKQRENDVKRPAEARKVLVASTYRKRLLADIPTDAGPRIAGSTGPRQWVDSLNGEAAGIGSAAHCSPTVSMSTRRWWWWTPRLEQ